MIIRVDVASSQDPLGSQPVVSINDPHKDVSWEAAIIKVATSNKVHFLCLISRERLIIFELNSDSITERARIKVLWSIDIDQILFALKELLGDCGKQTEVSDFCEKIKAQHTFVSMELYC
jgi:hypothetical protein